MYAVTSIWLVSRTRATLRRAEFGFFGVVVYTRVQTPRRCGEPLRAGVLVLSILSCRPFRTNCWIVGIRPAISLVCVSAAFRDLSMSAFGARRFAIPLLWCCYETRIPGLSARSPIPAVGRVAPLAGQSGTDAVLRLVSPCHPALIADRNPVVDLLHRRAQDRTRIAPGTSSNFTRRGAGIQNRRFAWSASRHAGQRCQHAVRAIPSPGRGQPRSAGRTRYW